MEQISANIPENDKPKMQTLTKLFEKLTKAETAEKYDRPTETQSKEKEIKNINKKPTHTRKGQAQLTHSYATTSENYEPKLSDLWPRSCVL